VNCSIVGTGGKGPLDFEIFSHKRLFLVLGGKKQISPLLASPGKMLEKSPRCPSLEKIIPTLVVGMEINFWHKTETRSFRKRNDSKQRPTVACQPNCDVE